jgi:hypothetical protein
MDKQMIIFDLETLADCEYRRHFVDPALHKGKYVFKPCLGWQDVETGKEFIPDYKSFYEACHIDSVIVQTCKLFLDLAIDNDIQIWSGRCESTREKTLNWIYHYFHCDGHILKMRPIGDKTPYHELKEKWLDERIDDMGNQAVSDIEFVFDSDPKSIEMFRRRGIFVFDCNQGK